MFHCYSLSFLGYCTSPHHCDNVTEDPGQEDTDWVTQLTWRSIPTGRLRFRHPHTQESRLRPLYERLLLPDSSELPLCFLPAFAAFCNPFFLAIRPRRIG